jgi:hypothetical protein
MAQQASLVQEGVDRFREAFDSLELERVQKQLAQRRKRLEKQIASGRRQWEKRTRKQVKRLRTEIRKNSLVKRLQSIQKDATSQVESGFDQVLSALRIASKRDVDRIDRRLGQIQRKLKDLEQAGTRKVNGDAASA